MSSEEKTAGRDEVKFKVVWNEKYAADGWEGSLTNYVLEPTIWRYDKNSTTDSSKWSETLNPDTNYGNTSKTWNNLSYVAGSGWRQIDFFNPRKYKLTSSEQTVTLTIKTGAGFGTVVNKSFVTLGAKTLTFTFKLPPKTEVSKASEWKPCNVVLKRGNDNAMDLKWTVPLSLREKDVGYTDTAWIFQASKNMSTKYVETRLGSTHYTADKIWCRDLGLNATSHAQEYNRNKYHPVTADRYLSTVTASVLFYDWGDRHPLSTRNQTKVTYTFKTPKAPQWGDFSYDSSIGSISCALTVPEGSDQQEVYDTEYYVTRKDYSNTTERTVIKNTTTKEKSITVTFNSINDAHRLPYDGWIDIKFYARTRGLAGNSSWVSKLYTIAHPPRAVISKININESPSSDGGIIILMNNKVTNYHPADTFELLRLGNTPINSDAQADMSPDWQSVEGASDDGSCSGFVDSLHSFQLTRGNHVWYRVKSTRSGYTEYGPPKKAEGVDVFVNPVYNDVVKIDSLTPGEDSESLKVVIGWNDDDSNGTEISWSEHGDAWQSTEQPSTYNVPDTWQDVDERGQPDSQVQGKYHSASLVIRGLSEGVAYYVKARRYFNNNDQITYADSYATTSESTYPITIATALKKVYLMAPQYVSRGEGARVSWTYDSDSDQKSWVLYRHVGNAKTVLVSGEDNLGSTALDKDLLSEVDEITLSIAVSVGSEHVESDPVVINVVDKPVLAAVTDSKLKAQPMRFYASCDTSTVDLITKVYSKGVSSGTPYGEIVQTDGDVVWSEKISPTWIQNQDGLYYTLFTLPTGLSFLNGGVYVLEVTAVSTQTGLSSDIVETPFEVDWLHLAHLPGEDTYVMPDRSNMSVSIYPAKPDNWQNGDVYDIYRVSNDSIDLIAEGQAYGTEAKDNWAPFGKRVAMYYRIANRTKDGDVQWEDYVYTLYGHQLRFDWGAGHHLDLPYNLELTSQYEKNYEMHMHLDGSTSGHWNPGFKRTDNFTTKLIRLEDNLIANQVRSLGEYSGPVFVRTPDAGAFQANVTVSGIENTYDNLLLGVKIKAERHSLTDIYRLQMNDYTVIEPPDAEPEEEYTRQQILVWSTDIPEEGNTYQLNESPFGEVYKVELSTSYDNYMESWMISSTYDGLTVTLGSFGSALDTYLETTASDPNTSYMLKMYYNIEE